MNIKKLGHCCFVVEPKEGVRIMTDPSFLDYGGESALERDISAVLITHEHADHFHIDSVKEVLKNNPAAKIITNSAVASLLEKEGIKIKNNKVVDFKNVLYNF